MLLSFKGRNLELLGNLVKMRRNILNPRLILIQNGIFHRCTLEEDNQICYYCTDPLQIKKKENPSLTSKRYYTKFAVEFYRRNQLCSDDKQTTRS